jgi:16S rRNA (adenine1518-N6/adenine1519-N6)-dimethyltransferase
MSLEKKIKLLLRKYNIRPTKHLGQNFLIDKSALEYIAELSNPKDDGIIVEIGSGVGNLTAELLDRGAEVLAVEKDKNLTRLLRKEFKDEKIDIYEGSILDLEEKNISAPYKVVGNIPYYLTGKILQKFLFSSNPPSTIILTVQKEVGERIVAHTPRASFLSMMVASFGEAKIKKIIKANNFWPEPKVDSVVLFIKINSKQGADADLIKLLRVGFKQPRKTLQNNLKNYRAVDKQVLDDVFNALKLTEKIRAHELSLAQWKHLLELLNKKL